MLIICGRFWQYFLQVSAVLTKVCLCGWNRWAFVRCLQWYIVFSTGVVPRLVELLGSNEPSVLTPALRTIGNIVTGNDSQTQTVLDTGVLQIFPHLLRHPKSSLQKEAAWTISNVTAGNRAQIQAVIDAGLVPYLTDLMHRVRLSINSIRMNGKIQHCWL